MVKLGTHEKPRMKRIHQKRRDFFKNISLILVQNGKLKKGEKLQRLELPIQMTVLTTNRS
jgi:hypothetical protein